MRRRSCGREAGFTLIELMVVVAIMGVAATIAVGAGRGWVHAMEHTGTRDGIVSDLRRANQQAVAEARTFCVRIAADGRSWATYRGACGSSAPVRQSQTASARVALAVPAFRQADGSLAADAVFSARGSATPGSLTVSRDGSTKEYLVSVEGLTARVSTTD